MSKIGGLEKLQKKLENLSKKAEEFDGKQSIPITELLTNSFIVKHTKFSSVEEMFNASGFKVETPEDFAAIPDVEWDKFINSVSSFENWQNMLGAAGKEWVVKKLGF